MEPAELFPVIGTTEIKNLDVWHMARKWIFLLFGAQVD